VLFRSHDPADLGGEHECLARLVTQRRADAQLAAGGNWTQVFTDFKNTAGVRLETTGA
jgi:hypothetical protein